MAVTRPIILAMLSAFAVDLPPLAYDHPYPGKTIIIDNYDGSISAWNGPCFPWLGVYACAKSVNGVCYIWAMEGKLRSTPNLMRHEIGRCNGWLGNEPTGRT